MFLPPPQNNRVLFLDMNAFFASCEQYRQPHLRGRPVVVTPTNHDAGCVIAASYEAKQLGVTTGCRVGEARQKIPGLQVIDATPKYYVSIHNTIADYLLACIGPEIRRLSIDEFAVPLDKTEQWTPNAHKLALKIKRFMSELFEDVIHCSIGIGPNMFLAKLATDIQKPDGLVIIQTHTLEKAFQGLKLRDLPGINWGMEQRLHLIGVRDSLGFYRMAEPALRRSFGTMGTAWWHALRGYNIGATMPGSAFGQGSRTTKSISHSHVLAPELRTKIKARTVLYKLWIKVAERLRHKQLGAQHIVMSARGHMDRWSYHITVQPTQNVFRVFQKIAEDYDKLPESFSPKQMHVVVYDLAPHSPNQPSLFGDTGTKVASAFDATQQLNDRYGRWTVKPASLLIAGDAAPNRIAFHAPDYAMD